VRIHGCSTLLGLDTRYCFWHFVGKATELTPLVTDTPNFQNSSFWNPNVTDGVGGWGDPNDDYQITDGGFADGFSVAYPEPHRVRRMYNPTFVGQTVPLVTLITPESQAAMVNGFVGDYIGFQAVFESGSHGAVHRMVGGCVSISQLRCVFSRLRRLHRDLFGECPSNAPAGCVGGPKWSPNGIPFLSVHKPVHVILMFLQTLCSCCTTE